MYLETHTNTRHIESRWSLLHLSIGGPSSGKRDETLVLQSFVIHLILESYLRGQYVNIGGIVIMQKKFVDRNHQSRFLFLFF